MNVPSAILLAAGRSERMGKFKPLLQFGDTTVLRSSINYLRAGGVDNIVVVVGHRAIEVSLSLSREKVLFAVNDQPASEMDVSIARGVEVLGPDVKAVLVAPVDHPAVSPEVVRQLISEWRGGASLVIPTWNGKGGHPVLVDLKFKQELLHLDPQIGLKGLFRGHQDEVVRVPVDCPYVARDMDTWDDYRTLHEAVFGIAPDIRLFD